MYLAFRNLKIGKLKRLTVIRKLKQKYEGCFSNLKWNNISAADVITS